MTLIRLLATTLILAAIGACTPNAMYRTSLAPCAMSTPDSKGCETSAMQEIGQQGSDTRYILSFVEFDDEGLPFHPDQQRNLLDALHAEAASRDVVIVTFVHGWHHNARDDDSNVQAFRQLLAQLAQAELARPQGKRRRVFGIYAGWRGESGTIPYVNSLTFWSRKDGARRVAEGSVRGLLGQVKAFRDALVASGGHTKMITIGHSFGAHVVFDAVAQYLMDQAANARIRSLYFPDAPVSERPREKEEDKRLILGYGDLVVIVNPAVEALRYEPLRLLVDQIYFHDGKGTERYAPRQPPIFVQVTSVGTEALEGDWATGVAFPIGRTFSTTFERKRYDVFTREHEFDLALTAMGHHKPFWTHDLNAPDPLPTPKPVTSAEDCREFQEFRRQWSVNGYLKPGWTRTYDSGARLLDLANPRFDPNNPFWMVRAWPSVIPDHNAIEHPVFTNFVTQLSADTDRLRDPDLCPETSAESAPDAVVGKR